MTDTEFQVSEPQTIASIHAGDRAAFASALERELDALYRFVARELRYHEALVLNETREDQEKALNALPSDQRLTFILRAIDGLSYAEIAAILNRPRSAVKDTYRTAREALREHFTARFKRAEVQPASTASPQPQAEAGRSSPGEG